MLVVLLAIIELVLLPATVRLVLATTPALVTTASVVLVVVAIGIGIGAGAVGIAATPNVVVVVLVVTVGVDIGVVVVVIVVIVIAAAIVVDGGEGREIEVCFEEVVHPGEPDTISRK